MNYQIGIVEDHALMRRALRSLLETEGYSIVLEYATAESFLQASELWNQSQIDLWVPLIIPSRANRLQSHQSFVALFLDISQLASCKSPYGLAILASVSPASLPS